MSEIEQGTGISAFVGTWVLTGSTSIKGELAIVDGSPDPNGVEDWLNGSGLSLFETVDATSGLSIDIQPDGTFSEQKQGNPEIEWYDFEGVLTEVEPFNGSLVANEQGVYLLADDAPEWRMPTENEYGVAVLRYDDGDTKISDRLEKKDDLLIRTMNVVTDELYFDRIVIVYRRSVNSDIYACH